MKRGDCQGGPRPCPLVSCRKHLLWDHVGEVSIVHPAAAAAVPGKRISDWTPDDVERALHAMPETCAVDVAVGGPATYDHVAVLLGCSGEAIRQEEERLLRLLRSAGRLREARTGDPPPRRGAQVAQDGPRLRDGETQGELFG